MSSLDSSMLPMLEMFVYETNTLVEQLDEIMLEAERSKELSQDSINEIFRIMHTIKGSSAMMGIDNVSHLAHSIEDMFFIIRDNPDLLKAHLGIFDILFAASDFFKLEVENVQNDTFEFNSCDDLMEKIKAQVAALKGEPAPVTDASTPLVANDVDTTSANSDDSDENEGQILIFFEDDCQMENIRAFMLLTSIHECCTSVDSIPHDPEKNSSCSQEIINNGFLVKFKPVRATPNVVDVIKNSLNIKSYEIIEAIPNAEVINSNPQQSNTVTANTATAVTPTAKSPEAQQPSANKSVKQNLISVNQSKVDHLMDLVGELVIAESMVISNPDLKGLQLESFNKSTRQLQKLTDELQDIVMSMRMVPMSGVFLKMQRILRDASKKLEKHVQLVTYGDDTQVDKTINDIIADPLMHMVRNSVDHAIEMPSERIRLGKDETGTVTLSAQNAGGEIVITIADDGKGLDTEAIMRKAKKNNLLTKPENEYTEKEIFRMILLPGFSTNETVTEFSGRGVGMDVVSKNIESVGGSISVDSKYGVGTTFTIKIPLTLAIIEGMQVLVGSTVFTLPITSISQSIKLHDHSNIVYDTDNSEMIIIRGKCYPVIRLHDIYGIENAKKDLCDGIVILIENQQIGACMFVDELIEKQQVVVKPFPPFLSKYDIKQNGLSGCTILGDGSISLILDANSLLERGDK